MENSQKVKTVMIGDHRFKLPFFDLIPFDHEQDNNLGEAIREAGAVLVQVVCWKEKRTSGEDTVVDGAHRIFWASKLGLAKVPIDRLSFADEDAAKEECERLNFQRRHSPEELLRANRIARLERIAARRQQGESTRAIAEAEKVSESQVRRDLDDSGAPGGGAPETAGGKTTGKDGKKYPAKRPPILCERCQRIGTATPGCEGCKEARAGKKGKGKTKKSPEPTEKFKDHFGNELPDHCRNAFCDPWIQETFDLLTVNRDNILTARITEQIRKRIRHYPFFKAQQGDFIDGINFVVQYLDQIIDFIKAQRPAGVCPACSGSKCEKCLHSGLVPRELYKKLKEAK